MENINKSGKMNTRAFETDGRVSEDDVADSESDEARSGSWFCLLNFATQRDYLFLVAAFFASLTSGLVLPILAIFVGKTFDVFTKFAAKSIDGAELRKELDYWIVGMIALGLGGGVFNSVFFSLWIAFGERQARSARRYAFRALLDKDMQWFDLEKTGVKGLSTRMQR